MKSNNDRAVGKRDDKQAVDVEKQGGGHRRGCR